MRVHGWTARYNLGSDRPDYEADIKNCDQCGRSVFMCDGLTRKPLPADEAMERCPFCFNHVCRRCKGDLVSGRVKCSNYWDRMEGQIREGSWI